MTIFASTAYGSDFWYSLEDIGVFFGFPKKNSGGDEIHDMFVNKQFDKIISHCKEDIELLRNIYKLL